MGTAAEPAVRVSPVAGGFVTFLGSLGGSDDEVVYSVGRVSAWFAEVALVYLVLAFPSGRLSHRFDSALAGGVALVALLLFVPTALLVDSYLVPATWTSCSSGCPGNAFQLLTHEPAWVGDVIVPLREALASLLFLGVMVRLLTRISNATTTMRRTLTPVLALAAVHAVALPIGFTLRRAGADSGSLLTVLWVLSAGIPIMAVGFLVGAARWRLAVGSALYRLAPGLQASTDHETLRRALADALDDPSLDLVYRGSDGGWLDSQGRAATPPGATPAGRAR